MKMKGLRIILCSMFVTSLALAACTPGTGSEVLTLNEEGSTTVNTAENGEPANNTGLTEADPGAGAGDAGDNTGNAGTKDLDDIYSDGTYQFSVSHPSDFVIGDLAADKLAELTPKPVAAIFIMDPITAKSEVPDEPADLEIRFYARGGETSLDGWLKSNGLITASDTQQEFKTDNVSGVMVCASTMIFPGCRYYVFGNDWVYQLNLTSQEGESMFNSFKLVP